MDSVDLVLVVPIAVIGLVVLALVVVRIVSGLGRTAYGLPKRAPGTSPVVASEPLVMRQTAYVMTAGAVITDTHLSWRLQPTRLYWSPATGSIPLREIVAVRVVTMPGGSIGPPIGRLRFLGTGGPVLFAPAGPALAVRTRQTETLVVVGNPHAFAAQLDRFLRSGGQRMA